MPFRLPLTALVLAVTALVVRTVEPVSAQQPPSMEQLRDAAGDYVRSAYPLLANLVGTEEYRQQVSASGSPRNMASSTRAARVNRCCIWYTLAAGAQLFTASGMSRSISSAACRPSQA